MLIREGDFELNLLQGFDKSSQNVLAQTMVGQDNIFRNQVTELHRLYQVQKILMQEMDQRVSSQICMPRHMKDNFLPDHASTCLKPEQRPDLERPFSFNTNLSGDILYEKCGRVATGAFVKMKCEFDNIRVSPTAELEFSLSINTETWKVCFAEKSREDQIICSPSQHYKIPKNSIETSEGNLVTITSPEYSTFSDYKLNLECSSCARSRKNDGFYWNARINPLADFRTNFQDKKPAIQGVEQRHDDLTCKVKSTRRKLFTSHEVVELDLNRALPEELPFNSIDPLLSYTSKCTFSSLSRNEQEIKCSNDSFNSDQQEMMDSTLATSPSKDSSKVNRVELSSICGPPSTSKKPGSCSDNTAFKLKLPHRSCQKISMHEVNARESSQGLAEGAGSNKFPISSKSDMTPEDISSNIKKGQCGVPMDRSSTTFQDRESSIPAKKLCQQSTIPSTKPKRKFQASNQKNNELPEVDNSVKNGAVSLLYLSSACSAKDQEYVPISIRRREISNVVRDVPQCSSESYESMVLKQPEISLDAYSVTSTPLEVNFSNEKDHGTKLKRGRRMKDFRKEILPGLASLSRQEICEDVRIMRGAIKSREYKNRSKMRVISDHFSPFKSKGSGHSRGRRRCYS
ncbi:uncharacterized protein LOC142542812 [Primulina tabacum]|uniref:uncharacterized protein LOC142542812 n=1 Tax=Primulina tabacum TaxID=48773 RepID=UPI003F5AB570